jgi:MurNAc alpha-1-phosphate uridylyltransferase
MQAMILAAGLGTRLKPITDKVPKALIPVRTEDGSKKPLLEILLDKMSAQGVTSVVINVHHLAEQIRNFIGDYLQIKNKSLQVMISDESDLLLDTGGAIRNARSLLIPGQPFLVHNVDILSDLDLNDLFNRHIHADMATLLVSQRDTSRQLIFDSQWHLVGWTNKKTGEVRRVRGICSSQECFMRAFSGIHVMSPDVLPIMENWPSVFSIIDFYLDQAETHVIRGTEIPGLKITDIGKPEVLRNIML